eukprot:Phypoly_transcript_01692.p2 GENE.Phypoly_transcript_01692~~Phypoly_transcript_01692.p2  ORF type:complete len:386 (+),score=47.74 Phypoly_transcript_01692:1484-2641(+)
MLEKYYSQKVEVNFLDWKLDEDFLFNRDIEKPKDYISFRKINDWMYYLKILSPDIMASSAHMQIFDRVLNWETTADPPDNVFTTRVQRRRFQPGKNFGRVLPIGPPSQHKEFFYDLDAEGNRGPWLLQCIDPATKAVYLNSGFLCEYPPNAPTVYPQPIQRFMAQFQPTDPGWQIATGGLASIPNTPGIFVVYGDPGKSVEGAPATKRTTNPNTVLHVGGGPNMKATIDDDVVRLKLGQQDYRNIFRSAAKNVAYYPLPLATTSEIYGYVNLIRTTFCTFAEYPNKGGAEFAEFCHPPADANGFVDIATFFAQHLLGRFVDKPRNPGPGNIPSIPTRLLNIPKTTYGSYSQESCLVANPTPGQSPVWPASTKRNVTEECEDCVHA